MFEKHELNVVFEKKKKERRNATSQKENLKKENIALIGSLQSTRDAWLKPMQRRRLLLLLVAGLCCVALLNFSSNMPKAQRCRMLAYFRQDQHCDGAGSEGAGADASTKPEKVATSAPTPLAPTPLNCNSNHSFPKVVSYLIIYHYYILFNNKHPNLVSHLRSTCFGKIERCPQDCGPSYPRGRS